jgi:hypothetical protein
MAPVAATTTRSEIIAHSLAPVGLLRPQSVPRGMPLSIATWQLRRAPVTRRMSAELTLQLSSQETGPRDVVGRGTHGRLVNRTDPSAVDEAESAAPQP